MYRHQFNEFMLKVIEAYPPPAWGNMWKLNIACNCLQNTSVCIFVTCHNMLRNHTNVLENKIRVFRVPIDIYIRERKE
jgi:hypothetical protein